MSIKFDEGKRMTDPAAAHLREKKKRLIDKPGANPKHKLRNKKKTEFKYGEVIKPDKSKLLEGERTYTFLYRYRLVLRLFCDRYNMSPRSFEFLIAAASFEYFYVDELMGIILMPDSFKKKELIKLRNDNMISIYQYKGSYVLERSPIYTVSKKGRIIVADFYAIMLEERAIPKYAWGG